MRVYLTLVRRELSGYFSSFSGYVVIASVLFLLGLSFNDILSKLNTEATEVPPKKPPRALLPSSDPCSGSRRRILERDEEKRRATRRFVLSLSMCAWLDPKLTPRCDGRSTPSSATRWTRTRPRAS